MAEATTNRYNYKYTERKDDELTLQEYHAMAIYVFVFNEIRNNPAKYGIKETTIDTAIDDYIFNNFSTLATNLGLDENLSADDRNCFRDIDKFKKIVSQAIGHAAEKSASDKVNDFNNFNSRPTNIEMHDILMQKRDETDKPYKTIKASTKRKDYQYQSDDKGGIKDGSGVIHSKLEAANNSRIGMIRNKRRSFGKMLFRMVRLVAAAALTAASVAVALPAGAAALTGFFSVGASVAGKLGIAIVGGLGAYFGCRRCLTNFIEVGACFKDWRKDVNKYKDFMAGRGAFSPDGMTMKGFKDLQKEQLIQEALLVWMDKGAFNGKDKKLLKYFKMAQKRGDIEGLGGDKYLNKLRTEHDYVANGKNKLGFVPILDKLNANAPHSSISTDLQYFEVEDKLKNINNFTQITESIGGTSVTRNRNLGELVESYELLNAYGEKFKGQIEANQNYKIALDKMDAVLIDTIKSEIFDKPYSNASIDNIKKLIETPVIKERLAKSTKFPDFTEKVKNYVDFISFENDSTTDSNVHRIREDLGVGFSGQTSLDKSDIKSTLKTFGTDSDPAVVTALNDISSKTSRTDVSAIDLTGISDAKTKAYLESVKNKKLSTIALNEADIRNGMPAVPDTDPDKATKDAEISAIVAKINGVTDSEALKISAGSSIPPTGKNKISLIRTEIANASFGDDIKKHLESKLFEQFEAHETKHRYDIKPKVIEKIKSGAIPNINEIMEKINKVDISDPKDGEVNKIDELYNTVIDPINNSQEVKDYLTARLGEEIENKIELEIMTMAPNAAVTKMDKLVITLKKITHCRYLTQLQKERLTKLFEENVLEKATNIQMSKYEKLYASLKKDDKTIISNLDKDYSKGGFKEYIQMGTAYGKALEARIKRLKEHYEDTAELFLLKARAAQLVDPSEEEIKAMSKMFFNRKLSESMFDIKTNIEDISNMISCFDNVGQLATDGTFKCDDTVAIIHNSKDKINNILASSMSNNDKMLCLLEVKRVLMLAIKQHAADFVSKRVPLGESPETAALRDGSIDVDLGKIRTEWKNMATIIDTAISNVLKDLQRDSASDSISAKAYEAYTEGRCRTLNKFIDSFTLQDMKQVSAAKSVVPEKGA